MSKSYKAQPINKPTVKVRYRQGKELILSQREMREAMDCLSLFTNLSNEEIIARFRK